MQEFRRFLRGPAGKILLVLILVPFVGIVFVDYFQGGRGADVVARVAGQPIYRGLVNQRVQETRSRVMQENPEMDSSLVDSYISPMMILEGMVNNLLVIDNARRAGMHVAQEQVLRDIVNVEAFQEDGVFSEYLFERLVRNAGYNKSSYIGALADEMLLNQYRTSWDTTEFALPYELADMRRLGEQRRDIRVAVLALDEVREGIEVKEDAARAYYDRHIDRYTRPEQVRIAYIQISPDRFDPEVTAADVEQEYEARRALYETVAKQREQRQVAHIMFETGSRRGRDEALALASAARDRIRGGEPFSDVARELSEDPATRDSGGDLGLVERGALPEPLEEMVFSLDIEQVSEAVESEGNVHLLQVSDVTERDIPPFEEMRESLREELVENLRQQAFSAAVAQLDELAFEHAGLEVPSLELGLEVRESEWFTLADPEGIASETVVRNALQTEQVASRGFNSDPLELPDGSYVVVRMLDTRPPEPLPFDDVKDRVYSAIRTEEARKRLGEMSAEAEEKLADGATLDELAKVWGADVQTAMGLQRGAGEPDPLVVERAFRLPRPEMMDPVPEVLFGSRGDLIAVELVAVRDGDLDSLDKQARAEARRQLAAMEGFNATRRAIDYLRQSGDIDLFPSRLAPEAGVE